MLKFILFSSVFKYFVSFIKIKFLRLQIRTKSLIVCFYLYFLNQQKTKFRKSGAYYYITLTRRIVNFHTIKMIYSRAYIIISRLSFSQVNDLLRVMADSVGKTASNLFWRRVDVVKTLLHCFLNSLTPWGQLDRISWIVHKQTRWCVYASSLKRIRSFLSVLIWGIWYWQSDSQWMVSFYFVSKAFWEN